MDCFSVALAKGIASGRLVPRSETGRISLGPVWMALFFGLFQGGMPLISFFAGSFWADAIDRIDHWIALILLSCVGGKMIWDSLQETDETGEKRNHFSFTNLFILAVATSIDAFSIGVLFVPYPKVLWHAVSLIGLISILFSLIGYTLGALLGRHLRINMDLIGGVLLILIGVKLFLEHLL